MTYQDLNKAICGFNSVLRFDDAKVFSCPSCGTSPKYIVADGKSDGPVKRKVWTCTDFEIDTHLAFLKSVSQHTVQLN